MEKRRRVRKRGWTAKYLQLAISQHENIIGTYEVTPEGLRHIDDLIYFLWDKDAVWELYEEPEEPERSGWGPWPCKIWGEE